MSWAIGASPCSTRGACFFPFPFAPAARAFAAIAACLNQHSLPVRLKPPATEEELDGRIEEIAEKSGDTPAQIYANLQKSERLEALEREITERKVFDFLKEQSEITEN